MEHSPECTTAFSAWFTVIQSLGGLTEIPHSHILGTSALPSAGRMESLQFLHSAQGPAWKGEFAAGTHLHTQSAEWDWRSLFPGEHFHQGGVLKSFFNKMMEPSTKLRPSVPSVIAKRPLDSLNLTRNSHSLVLLTDFQF